MRKDRLFGVVTINEFYGLRFSIVFFLTHKLVALPFFSYHSRYAKSFQINFLCVIFKYAKNLLLYTLVSVTIWVSERERLKSVPNNIIPSSTSRVLPTDVIRQLRNTQGNPPLSGRKTSLIGMVIDLDCFRLSIAYLSLTAQK